MSIRPAAGQPASFGRSDALLCVLPVVAALSLAWLAEKPALALTVAFVVLVVVGAALAVRRMGLGGVWLCALCGSILLGELSAIGFGGQQGRILWADGVLAIGLAIGATSRRVLVPRAPFLVLLLPLLAWSALGLMMAPDVLTGLAELKEWIAAAIAGMAAVTWARDTRRALLLLSAVAATAAWIAVAMLWTALYHPAGAVPAVMMKLVDLPWGRSNYLAGILILAFPIALGLLGYARGVPGRLALGVTLVALGLGLVVSASKGAFLALVVAAALAYATGGRAARKPALALLLLLGAGTLLYVASPLRHVLDYRLQASALDYSAGERFGLYRLAWDVFVSHPIAGVGLNNFSVVSNVLHGIDLVPHNLELGFLAELGLVGALLGMIWVGALGWTAWRLGANARDPRAQALGLGLWASWLAFLLHNQLESTLYGQQFKLLLFVVAAATWRLSKVEESPRPSLQSAQLRSET
jgi:O-antigen ligase